MVPPSRGAAGADGSPHSLGNQAVVARRVRAVWRPSMATDDTRRCTHLPGCSLHALAAASASRRSKHLVDPSQRSMVPSPGPPPARSTRGSWLQNRSSDAALDERPDTLDRWACLARPMNRGPRSPRSAVSIQAPSDRRGLSAQSGRGTVQLAPRNRQIQGIRRRPSRVAFGQALGRRAVKAAWTDRRQRSGVTAPATIQADCPRSTSAATPGHPNREASTASSAGNLRHAYGEDQAETLAEDAHRGGTEWNGPVEAGRDRL